jgi:hypothetical protein
MRLRFRAGKVASLASTLGLVPLGIAEGAVALSRRGAGRPLLGDPLAASFLRIFAILPLHLVVQWSRERMKSGVVTVRGKDRTAGSRRQPSHRPHRSRLPPVQAVLLGYGMSD